MSGEQLQGWLAYFNIEPFGYDMQNYRSGIIAASILNSVRGKESDKVWSYKDFYIENTKRQDWRDQYAIAQSICAAFSRKEII